MNETEKITENNQAPLQSAERFVRQYRRRTQRKFAAEEKIRIVIESFKREITVAELCRREDISSGVFYNWLKAFMEGGKGQLLEFIEENEHRTVIVVSGNGTVSEILTDGDVRKALIAGRLLEMPISDVMNTNFISILEGEESKAEKFFKKNQISFSSPLSTNKIDWLILKLLETSEAQYPRLLSAPPRTIS